MTVHLRVVGNVSIVISEGDCECCGRFVQDDELMVRFGDDDIYYVCYKCLYTAYESMEICSKDVTGTL